MMIENKELYTFDQEPDTAGPQTELTPPDESEFNFITKLLHQTIITICCLIILLTVSRTDLSWMHWIRNQFHSAITASQEATFGRIGESSLWQTILTNAGNLVRLEQITKDKFVPELTINNRVKQIFLNSVWPVQGSITKGYGWSYNTYNKTKEFNPGLEITASPDSVVVAISDGVIAEVNHQLGIGWQIVINHGDGWSSKYHYLGFVNVKVGQRVKGGDPIAHISRPNQEKGPVLLLEIKEYNQPVDPLSVLVSMKNELRPFYNNIKSQMYAGAGSFFIFSLESLV